MVSTLENLITNCMHACMHLHRIAILCSDIHVYMVYDSRGLQTLALRFALEDFSARRK